MNPRRQHLFEIYTTLSYVRVASYTSHTQPCLNTKQLTVKVISKDQLPLEDKIIIDYFDNGLGLGDEEAEKVFDLFYTTKRNTNCTGLGMPIIYNQITQTLLGSIDYIQQEKQGIRFTICIPAHSK